MSTVPVTAADVDPCKCSLWQQNDNAVRRCDVHHAYYRGAKPLVSVSKILRSCWPIPKDFEKADPAVLEHARDRGVRIDRYFCDYLNTGSVRIAAGEWEEVVAGVQALVKWWNQFHPSLKGIKTQVILADSDVAGTADFLIEGGEVFDGGRNYLADLKVVYALDPSYELQIGAYCDLHGHIERAALIHLKIKAGDLTAVVQVVPVDVERAVLDWRIVRDVYFMAQRRTKR